MQQMSLSFEPGLAQRYPTLRECIATQVYTRGHGRIAGQLDLSPSKLTEKLAGLRSDGKSSGVTVDELERYIERTGDLTPIFYLADKFLRDPKVRQQEALERIAAIADQLPHLMSLAGLQPQGKKRG